MKAGRVRRERNVSSVVSGIISAVNSGYLPVACFSWDTFRNAAYGFKEGEGPKIVIRKNKKTFVRLFISKCFEVVFETRRSYEVSVVWSRRGTACAHYAGAVAWSEARPRRADSGVEQP